MAHRNRWFTWVYLFKMVDLSMAMLNNQMVHIITYHYISLHIIAYHDISLLMFIIPSFHCNIRWAKTRPWGSHPGGRYLIVPLPPLLGFLRNPTALGDGTLMHCLAAPWCDRPRIRHESAPISSLNSAWSSVPKLTEKAVASSMAPPETLTARRWATFL